MESMASMDMDTLYYGDCLDWMTQWPDRSVDLVYLDPPFNSNMDYNILFDKADPGGQAQYRAFEDTWNWDAAAAERYARIEGGLARASRGAIAGLFAILGPSGMMAYLTYMAERLEQIGRLLTPAGSVYLHCDPTAGHYLKVLMDGIFGAQNFRNEIVWRIGWVSGYKTQKQGWIRNHDTILYYLNGDAARRKFNKEYIPYPPDYVRRDGKRPTGKGIPVEDTWNCSNADILDSIMIKSFSSEKLGYPTQKPRALLERIVKASSNEGDVILDPFCGCGTTIDAVRRVGQRHWVGIDISAFAIDLIRQQRLKDATIPVKGIPFDLAAAQRLARERPFDFETWAVTRLPGFLPNTRQRGDGGVDGRGVIAMQPDNHASTIALAQVKGGRFALEQFRAFRSAIERDKAALGVFITLERVSSPSARREAAAMGEIAIQANRFPRLQLWSVAEYFEGKLPQLPIMKNPYTGKTLAQGELL